MTECPICKGRGTVGYYHIDHFVDVECDRCNGSGEVSEVEMTNEEWLRSATTEQLAEFLIASIKKCKSCANGIGVDEVQHCPFGECGCHFKGEVIEWLKKPHSEVGK